MKKTQKDLSYEYFQKDCYRSYPRTISAEDVKIESSTCTGEKTIGFYDKSTKS